MASGAWGGRHPNRNYYASDAQVSYLRHLLNEAFAKGYSMGVTVDLRASITRKDASEYITRLVAAKSNGWKDGV